MKNILRKKLLLNAVSRLECPLLVCKYKIRFFFLKEKMKKQKTKNKQNQTTKKTQQPIFRTLAILLI